MTAMKKVITIVAVISLFALFGCSNRKVESKEFIRDIKEIVIKDD